MKEFDEGVDKLVEDFVGKTAKRHGKITVWSFIGFRGNKSQFVSISAIIKILTF